MNSFDKKKTTVEQAINRLAAWCSRAERCIYDVRKKLDAYDFSEDEKGKIISRLVSERFIDEIRFVRAYVNCKTKYNRWGAVKIRYELLKKNIPETLIDYALVAIQPEENIERLAELLARKRKSVRGENEYEIRQKLLRFALSRGFSFEDAEKAMESYKEK